MEIFLSHYHTMGLNNLKKFMHNAAYALEMAGAHGAVEDGVEVSDGVYFSLSQPFGVHFGGIGKEEHIDVSLNQQGIIGT